VATAEGYHDLIMNFVTVLEAAEIYCWFR